jgi:hypothetical protein
MNYIQQKLLARDKDDKKFIQFTSWLTENTEKMGVQITDKLYVDGSYDLSYQEKTDSYIIEINTANEEFADEAIIELKRLCVDEIKMLGIIKTVGDD